MSGEYCTATYFKNHIRREVFVYEVMLDLICAAMKCTKFQTKATVCLRRCEVWSAQVRCVFYFNIAPHQDTEYIQSEQISPALCFNFIHNVGLTFHCQISLHYSPFSQGSFSIEIRCSEYITLTSCCQHWFPFLPEIWCWNPLQADKYLYTWLPDLIAFCKGGCVGVTLNACHSTLYSSSVMPYYAPRRALI